MAAVTSLKPTRLCVCVWGGTDATSSFYKCPLNIGQF